MSLPSVTGSNDDKLIKILASDLELLMEDSPGCGEMKTHKAAPICCSAGLGTVTGKRPRKKELHRFFFNLQLRAGCIGVTDKASEEVKS